MLVGNLLPLRVDLSKKAATWARNNRQGPTDPAQNRIGIENLTTDEIEEYRQAVLSSRKRQLIGLRGEQRRPKGRRLRTCDGY